MADERFIFRLFHSLLFIGLCVCTVQSLHSETRNRVNVIIAGATGDLAKRYLWNGFFNLYRLALENNEKTTFRFFGGASRLSNEDGKIALNEILENAIKCRDNHCKREKTAFMEKCTYVRLKDESDYEELQRILGSSMEDEVEIGRILYLSVPPHAYETISQYIDSKCRPKNSTTWMRVILEKPFGSDLESAQRLGKAMSKYLNEEEIYRIDHYLGKSGVQQITQFRNKNRLKYEPIWNKNFIEQVKIVMKETGGTEGRMSFYDHYGVIRDVFQNHLTEIMVLIAAELSDDDSTVAIPYSRKLEVLKVLRTATLDNTVLGQYKDYNTQLRKEITEYDGYSDTPTFAATAMYIDNSRWSGVPFILVSGKSLETRVAYVHLLFKRNQFCVSNDLDCTPKEIIFYIQGDYFDHPFTSVSNSLPAVQLPDGWERSTLVPTKFPILQGSNTIVKPPLTNNAHTTLIYNVFHGNKDMFVTFGQLLLAWQVWTPLLKMSAFSSPKLYTPHKIHELDFEIVHGKMKFIVDENNDSHGCKSSYFHELYENADNTKLNGFRGSRLVSGQNKSLALKLANDIKFAALAKTQSGGVFHLALSGGTSPQLLFQTLAFFVDGFPWQQTHVWLVDERCVSLTDDQSNFKSIYESLLKYVAIPYLNIHPMQVDIVGRLCDGADKQDETYEQFIKHYMHDASFDFVVLGVGRDGHTASLFPNQESLHSMKFVEFTTCSSGLTRMTLTFQILNRAQQIAVLIQGIHKGDIVKELSKSLVDINRLPITGIKPVNGSSTWYIDNHALHGHT